MNTRHRPVNELKIRPIRRKFSVAMAMSWILLVGLMVCDSPVVAGVWYAEPAGGWRYIYEGTFNQSINGLPPGYGSGVQDAEALDGSWNHDQGDKWDGSAPGVIGPIPAGPAPGGVGTYSEPGASNYIRLQDTGNPERHGWTQGVTDPQNSNRRLNFGHRISQDGELPSQLILDNGFTFSFRARIPDFGPLDDIYTTENNVQIVRPWGSVGGGGYPIHDEGRGMFYAVQNDPDFFNQDGAIAFSLMTSADVSVYAQTSQNTGLIPGQRGGLVMNNLLGNVPAAQIDTYDAGTLNLLEIDDGDLRQWQEFWITIQANGSAPGTHRVDVYRNGVVTPASFDVTISSDGNAEYVNDAWLAMGLSSSDLWGVVDVDFYAYSLGVISPQVAVNGDFDGNGLYNCNDVDSLVSNIALGTNSANFDLTGDGIVNVADLTRWLQSAGAANLPNGQPYLIGDADLDGVVDGSDFIAWNNNKFTHSPAWCSGDFNADGNVDGQDFIAWNNNKFTSSDSSQVVVPEAIPGTMALGITLLAAVQRSRSVIRTPRSRRGCFD